MEMRKCETHLTKVSTAMIEVPEKSNINEVEGRSKEITETTKS